MVRIRGAALRLLGSLVPSPGPTGSVFHTGSLSPSSAGQARFRFTQLFLPANNLDHVAGANYRVPVGHDHFVAPANADQDTAGGQCQVAHPVTGTGGAGGNGKLAVPDPRFPCPLFLSHLSGQQLSHCRNAIMVGKDGDVVAALQRCVSVGYV